jgi:hypothetical protein
MPSLATTGLGALIGIGPLFGHVDKAEIRAARAWNTRIGNACHAAAYRRSLVDDPAARALCQHHVDVLSSFSLFDFDEESLHSDRPC